MGGLTVYIIEKTHITHFELFPCEISEMSYFRFTSFMKFAQFSFANGEIRYVINIESVSVQMSL